MMPFLDSIEETYFTEDDKCGRREKGRPQTSFVELVKEDM